ncbi:MAG: alpha/beta hydrolase [Fimbriimonadaceae bacterium]
MSFEYRFVPGRRSDVVLVTLHGTGGTENDLIEIGDIVAMGWPILSPRGNVQENGHGRFFRRFAEGVFDEDSMREQTDLLSLFLREKFSELIGEDVRAYGLGYSNGANMAACLALLHPGTLQGACLWRAGFPIQPEVKPALNGFRGLAISGKFDSIVPPEDAKALTEYMNGCGANAEWSAIDAGHGLTRTDIDMAQRFFDSI